MSTSIKLLYANALNGAADIHILKHAFVRDIPVSFSFITFTSKSIQFQSKTLFVILLF